MRLIGYIRVSTDDQRDGLSLQKQAQSIYEYCEQKGYQLLAIYWDAESGENMRGRAGFQQAVRSCNRDEADGLIVNNFDRYSRDSLDSEMVFRVFQKKNKHLISVQQPFDLGNKYGRFTFRVNQSVAQLVREEITERLYTMRMAKGEAGGWIGHRPPFGWRVVQGNLVQDPTETRVIKLICRLRKWVKSPRFRDKAMSLNEIADYLNARIEGGEVWLSCKSGKDNLRERRRPYKHEQTPLWNAHKVQGILKNHDRFRDTYKWSVKSKIQNSIAS